MLCRCILPPAAYEQAPNARRVLEGNFTDEQIKHFNEVNGYGIFYLPNGPSNYVPGTTVDGSHIDVFQYVYVDFDLKSGTHASKEDFLAAVGAAVPLAPTSAVDSGNGVHVYWAVSDLDPMSFLRINRRLCRLLGTDEAVSKIFQLMRLPGTLNTKDTANPKPCEEMYATDSVYTCEDLDAVLPPLSHDDEQYCQDHFHKTYNVERKDIKVDATLPKKFEELLHQVPYIRDIWEGQVEDRSKADFELGHILWERRYTQDEARSILVNCAKAVSRAPVHRIAYADNIIEKVWKAEEMKQPLPETLSRSVAELLAMGPGLEAPRFPCDRVLDATEHGFRLGEVLGLVAGSGVGKTAMALNMFRWFVKNNPNHVHFFVPLEQPAAEIALRWKTMAGDDTHLHEKVHVLSNYNDDGSFRHLTFEEIKTYLLEFKAKSGRDIGCVVIDHIGALKKKGKEGENQDLMDICHSMKAFAVGVNCFLVMQSQAPREKAGIGDLELNKDAAYGTVYFESYCDYLVTIWQPLKRMYKNPACPSVTAYKFCKIRNKKRGFDQIQEDTPYRLIFDPITEHMRPMTQAEEGSFPFHNTNATNARKHDKKTDVLEYTSTSWLDEKKGA